MSAKVLIAGAGLGGLTAAACLMKRGFQVRIFKAFTYDITGLTTGLQPVVSGQLSKEPRQRLPRDEIIRMAVP